MINKKLNIILFILFSFVFSNTSSDCDNCYNPIANAGDDEIYFIGCNGNYTQVCLDGSKSNDYESLPLSYVWSLNNVINQDSNIPIELNLWPDFELDMTSNPCFTVPYSDESLIYQFRLIVNDGQYSSDPDFVDVLIETENTSPTFSTNPDTTFVLKIGESFNLDLSSIYDLTSNGATNNGYNVLDVNLSDFTEFSIQDNGNYIYTLTAINSNSSSNTLTISDGCNDVELGVNVTITGNELPYSIAGQSQNIWSGDSFTIDAGLSFDPDGDSFIYEWIIPDDLLDQMNSQSVSDQILSFNTYEGQESVYLFELNVQESQTGNYSNPNNGDDIFISEYYEPVSNYPKYIELYNSEIENKSLNDYEIWFIDGADSWDGSSLASSLNPSSKLLFNSCTLDGASVGEINGVQLVTSEDCCLQLSPGYQTGNEYSEDEGNFGICVQLDESNNVVSIYDDITTSGDCLLDTAGQGKWLVPYFDDDGVDYQKQCKAMIFGDPEDTMVDYNMSNGSWIPSCVDNDILSDNISQSKTDSLNSLSALLLTYSYHDELENKNYIIWEDIEHGGDDSYAIIKKFDGNSDGEIIDIVGDCNGNSNSSWIQSPLQNSRLIRKEKVFSGNINWEKSLGESEDESDWYIYKDDNELNTLEPASNHYCGACDNKITITSFINNPPVPILDTPHFIASIDNQFTVGGESSYDPDGYDVYFHWSADDGIGLGCLDGISSTEESCCLSNSINCENGNFESEEICCDESYGQWNVEEDGTLGNLCDANCCFVEKNPWVESYWDNNGFCFDYMSYDEESCCVNNGGDWSEIDASLNVYECIDSIGIWNGEKCEVSTFENSPEECCIYARDIDGEDYIGGVWDDTLGMCLGGTAYYKDNGQCFGGNDFSHWNVLENKQTSTTTFSIFNQPGNCDGEYITERDCCLLSAACDGSDDNERECCENNIITPHCSNDDNPENPTFSEQFCCEGNGGTWLNDECSGEPSETWIETYWDEDNDVCMNGTDAWLSWNYDNDICEYNNSNWYNNSILPITLYVSDGYTTSSNILQINVVEDNDIPTAIAFVEKMKFDQNEEEYFTICENYLYQNQEDCESNGFPWKGIAYEGYEIYLNGSESYDQTSTGNIEYRWEAPAGIELSSEFDANPTFTIDNYIAPLVNDLTDFNGNRACDYSVNYPDQYDAGFDCSVGYCSNDDSACTLNNECCDCDEEEDLDACYESCSNYCIDYITEYDCCESNGGNWNVLNDGVTLGNECDSRCCGNAADIIWNNCYLDLDFSLTVSDGGYVAGDNSTPSASVADLSLRVQPRMTIVGEIKAINNLGSSISMDENEYLRLYTSENNEDNIYTYDPEGHHSLEYSWDIGSVDGKPDVILSGYCGECSELNEEECSQLLYCDWNNSDSNNAFCNDFSCSSVSSEAICDDYFFCTWNSSYNECDYIGMQNIDVACALSDCEFFGFECIENNEGLEQCCVPTMNDDGFLECIDEGLSCSLGSLCFNNLPENCLVYDNQNACEENILCEWENSECISASLDIDYDIDDINNLNTCIHNESSIYLKSSQGLGDFVDYSITLSVEDINESDNDFKISEDASSIVRVSATYPIANAGRDMVHTSGYNQVVLNGYMSHDPQADQIDFSYWVSNCSDGVSPNEFYCEEKNETWHPGGVWYKETNLGILAYYENFDLISSSGYNFNWRYDLLGNCDDDNKFCFSNDDCNDDSVCIQNIYKDTYLPLYQNLIGEGQAPYGDFDSTAVNPFFAAPTLICDNQENCDPIRLFFELTVVDENNSDSSLKISYKDTVFVDVVANGNPVANAGDDLRVHVGTEIVHLNANQTYDETPLEELNFLWTNNRGVQINDFDSKKPYFSVPSDLCSDNVSLNEKECCENNGGTWTTNQACTGSSSSSWNSEKEINFYLTVCDGDCDNGFVSSDTMLVTYSAYTPPKQPTLYSKTDHEKINLFWDDLSEESIDDLSLYSDFQGYKIYRSEDYGETWGDPIYRDGELKGWVPYHQVDMSFETDSLYCLYKFSDEDCEDYRYESITGSVNWYPGYDWQDLGDNSGLVHALVDSNVTDGIEYTYTITAYDRGYKPDTLQYGSYGKLELIEGLNVWNQEIWKPEVPKFVFTEQVDADSFYFYKMDFPIRYSSIVNQTTHMYEIEIPPEWNVGENDEIVSQTQIDNGVEVYNTNNLWPSSNKDGYPIKWSLETPLGTSLDDINYQLAVPGYTSSNITSPIGDTLSQFIALDCRSVGNGDVSYEIVNESLLTDELIKLEIQAFEEENDIFENYLSSTPCLYGYNVIPNTSINGRVEHIINIDDENCIDDCALDCPICTFPLESSGGAYDFTLSENNLYEIYEYSNVSEANSLISVNDFDYDDVLDLPGVLIDTLSSSEANLYVPNYFIACHPITNIDDLEHENNWTDYFKGVTMKFDNAPSEIPETSVARTKNVSMINGNSFYDDSVLLTLFEQSLTLNVGFGIEIILSDLFGHVNLLYFDQDAFDKKAAYTYEIELIDPIISPPDTALFSSTDIIAGSYEACGRSFSTLVPFKVKNLTTNKYVKFSHTDNGKWNGDINSADYNFPTAGILETHPGYKDCVWTPGEWISFYSDTTRVGSDENIEEKTFKLEFIYNDETVALLRPEMCGFAENNSQGNFNSVENFALNTRYDLGECVRHEGLIWYATDDVDDDLYNVPNVYYEVNGVNQNPWKPVYPWHNGSKITIEPQSWFVDGDYWVGDMSTLGRINDIREDDLSEIGVVPNPYIVTSLFNEDANGNRLRFTHLPSKCEINIFTVSGEHIRTINHESLFNDSDGNEWWDLKNSSGRKVAPGLYIYKVETENGLSKIGKFAIVR